MVGGGGAFFKKKIFRPFGPQFGPKKKGGGGGPVSHTLDPPLSLITLVYHNVRKQSNVKMF